MVTINHPRILERLAESAGGAFFRRPIRTVQEFPRTVPLIEDGADIVVSRVSLYLLLDSVEVRPDETEIPVALKR